MVEQVSSGRIIESFLGVIFALIVAGFTWLIKTAYDRHKKISTSIVKLERTYVENLSHLQDTKYLLDLWIDALRENEPYTCAFTKLAIEDDAHYALSDMGLVNTVVKANFIQKRLNSDIENIYEGYRAVMPYLMEEKMSIEHFKAHSQNLLPIIEKIREKVDEIEEEMVGVIAYIRLAGRQRRHSLFGYIQLLNIDLYPRVTSKKVELEKVEIENEKRNKQSGKVT